VVEVRDNDPIARLAQDAEQAQAVRSAGDARNDGMVFVQTALFAQDGLDVIEHNASSRHCKWRSR
jgi:hypothetical protein